MIIFLELIKECSTGYLGLILCLAVGKLPANYMSDERMEGLRKMKEEENDKLLSRYKAFCGKVRSDTYTIFFLIIFGIKWKYMGNLLYSML